MANQLTNWSFELEDGEKITKVMIRHGFIVDGIGFETVKNSNSGIPLSSGEFITYISGSYGMYYRETCITTMKIHTNLRPDGYGPYGRAQGAEGVTDFISPLPLNSSIVGFFGSYGVYLASIGINAERTMITPYGPYGNSESSPNWSIELNEGQRFSKVRISHGYIVDGIGFDITDQSGKTTPTQLFGGSGGSPSEIDLGVNETITQISGSYGKYFGKDVAITMIKIHTNKRPDGYGPYGRAQEATDVKPFSTPLPLKGVVFSFQGHYGQYLNSIGISDKYKTVEKYGPYGRA
ncbi:hypothetical protein SOVF_177240 [Spinacia oleracea]|nr:hypothetical protein SOVF_177240 [Spinacia oleracea]